MDRRHRPWRWPDKTHAQIEIEFLVPARGDGSRRIVQLQPGLTAQALRHLDILTENPLELAIGDKSPVAGELEFRGSIRLPRVGNFVIQKALIHSQRTRNEQVKEWKTGVDLLADVLDKRAGEPSFLAAVSDQYPVEKRPDRAYFQREIRAWLEQLREARAPIQDRQ